MERGKRTLLGKIAEEAGASPATVSKVLNARPGVGAARRAQITRILRAHGYSVRVHSSGRTRPSILCAFASLGTPYSVAVLHGIVDEAHAQGIGLYVDLIPQDSELQDSWLNRHMAQGAGAIVLVTASPSARFMSNVDKNGIHAVAIDMKSNPPAHVPTLSAANFTGAYEATSHLVELGHRRIAFVGNSTQFDYARERFAGYRSALEAAHLVMEPELVFQGEPEFTPGLVAGRDIAAMHNRPTAVFCVSDPVAFGVIEGAREAGLRVPEDLSVVGFDDIEPANWSSPQLTTVRQPIYEMGRTSVSIAYKLLTGEPVHSVHTQLATTLVVRGSTATVRG